MSSVKVAMHETACEIHVFVCKKVILLQSGKSLILINIKTKYQLLSNVNFKTSKSRKLSARNFSIYWIFFWLKNLFVGFQTQKTIGSKINFRLAFVGMTPFYFYWMTK